MKKIKNYFTPVEISIWSLSVFIIILSYIIFQGESLLTLINSLIGATSLILIAKGNPIGQFLTIVFSIIYGIISYGFAYYGEMLTYLLMTAPMALFALISWIKNPFMGKKSEVAVNKISKKEIIFMWLLTGIVTLIFYYILKYFNTANLMPSTLSITTSFLAVYLTFRRSPYYALAYAANDVVLIILWVMASFSDRNYISVAVCFVIFLINDIYGFVNWRHMQVRQESILTKERQDQIDKYA